MKFFHKTTKDVPVPNKEEVAKEPPEIPIEYQKETLKVPEDYAIEEVAEENSVSNGALFVPLETEKNKTTTSTTQAKTPIQLTAINENEKLKVYELIFKFGLLTYEQISKATSLETAEILLSADLFDIKTIKHHSVFFFNQNGIGEYSMVSKIPKQELKKVALWGKKTKTVNVSQIETLLREIDILIAFDSACRKERKYEIEGWASTSNPRNKKPLASNYISPDLVIEFLYRNKRCCGLFCILPTYEAFFASERKALYIEAINQYSRFLSSSEILNTYIREKSFFISLNTLAIFLVLPANSKAISKDLFEYIKQKNITAPIYLSTFEHVLKSPLLCWNSSHSKPFFRKKK